MDGISSTVDGLMERHVAGMLPLPLDVMARSHLELKFDNRTYVRNLETLAGMTLGDIDPKQLTSADEMLDGIFASEAPLNAEAGAILPKRAAQNSETWMPNAIREFIGHDDVPWRSKMPGFKEFHIGDVEGCEVNLFWIKAGRALPTHTHNGSELTLVLDGGFSDGIGHYVRGDISIADETVDHRPVADDDGPCIGFAVTTDSLRLTGSLRSRVMDILGRG